jgi:hypothetical protein
MSPFGVTEKIMQDIKPFAKQEQKVLTVTIDEDGDLIFLKTPSSDIFLELGTVVTRRASHITPRAFFPRLAFKILRGVFGDKGTIAEWTREWSGPWRVDMRPVGAPVIDGDWTTRQEAIDFEIEYLNRWFLYGKSSPKLKDI